MPEGRLPVYGVDTEEQARTLLTVACGTNSAGEWIARELAQEQTLEALEAFAVRLQSIEDMMRERGVWPEA